MAKKKGQEPQTALTPEEAHQAIVSNADALLAMAQEGAEPGPGPEAFTVWDSTSPGYLVDQGLPRLKCPPESGFFPTDARGAPDLKWIAANSVPKYPEDPLAIDIECYGKTEPDGVTKYTSTEIGYLVSVVKEFHKARPAQRVGIYMTPPERYGGCSPYTDPSHPEYQKRWADWTTRNQVMIPLAQEADILFPSLYGLYSKMDQWERFARQNVEQTRMISQGKPVLGYLWPTWHNNAEAEGPIGYDDWMIMLEVCKSTCDGICIWDFSTERFDASEPWWKATVAFLTKHHLNGY